jgi:hypothetical protein
MHPPRHSHAGGDPARPAPEPWSRKAPISTWFPACAGMTAPLPRYRALPARTMRGSIARPPGRTACPGADFMVFHGVAPSRAGRCAGDFTVPAGVAALSSERPSSPRHRPCPPGGSDARRTAAASRTYGTLPLTSLRAPARRRRRYGNGEPPGLPGVRPRHGDGPGPHRPSVPEGPASSATARPAQHGRHSALRLGQPRLLLPPDRAIVRGVSGRQVSGSGVSAVHPYDQRPPTPARRCSGRPGAAPTVRRQDPSVAQLPASRTQGGLSDLLRTA